MLYIPGSLNWKILSSLVLYFDQLPKVSSTWNFELIRCNYFDCHKPCEHGKVTLQPLVGSIQTFSEYIIVLVLYINVIISINNGSEFQYYNEITNFNIITKKICEQCSRTHYYEHYKPLVVGCIIYFDIKF